jgi:hypothetical protein
MVMIMMEEDDRELHQTRVWHNVLVLQQMARIITTKPEIDLTTLCSAVRHKSKWDLLCLSIDFLTHKFSYRQMLIFFV